MKHFLTNFLRMGGAVSTPPIRLKMRSILLVLWLFLSVSVWGAETTYVWGMPFSSTVTNADLGDDNNLGATIGAYTSKGALNNGSWGNTNNGSYFNVSTNGYFLIKIPISAATSSFSIQANIFAWKSNKYAAKSVDAVYYTSKKNTTTTIGESGSTTSSGCFEIDQDITLDNSYTEDDGTLYIKITPAAGNVGFELLTISTTSSGETGSSESTD